MAGRKTDLEIALTKIATSYRSPLRYPGGKQKAIDQIAQVLPQKASEYREPMVGGGSVFFHARSIDFAEKYWINDKFTELASFWQTVQKESLCAQLMKDLETLRASFKDAAEIKRYFLKVRDEAPEDRYRQALLFFFFNRVTFSGTTKAGGFSAAASISRFTASSIEKLAPLPRALAGVKITNSDLTTVVTADGEDVFIFLDPPYYTASKLYGKSGALHTFDHKKLADLLSSTKHRFLITYDDCPEIRSLYKFANIRPWHLRYGMNNCNVNKTSKLGKELFISNY